MDGYVIIEDIGILDMMLFLVCFWVKLIYEFGLIVILLFYFNFVFVVVFLLDI